MADNNTTYDNEEVGHIQISEHVVATIAGVAATEVDGVASLVGNITNEIVTKMGFKMLAKGVDVNILGDAAFIDLTININYGTTIKTVCTNVQEKVVAAVENMTGLSVAEVNVTVADVTIKK